MFGSFKNIREKLTEIKNRHILSHKSVISDELSFFFDDTRYKMHFENITGLRIYNSHINGNFICCAFCSRLRQSDCHEFCFKCSKETYKECSPLLPGTFSFDSGIINSSGEEVLPWIFKTPCTAFERIVGKNYYKNFVSLNRSITVANFEVLEGLFTGISRGKTPCHICASVNLEIYNECSKKGIDNFACSKVEKAISERYEAANGMIRYT